MGVRFDQTLVLQGNQSAKDYPQPLRGIRYKDPETGKRLLFITNNTARCNAATIRSYSGSIYGVRP